MFFAFYSRTLCVVVPVGIYWAIWTHMQIKSVGELTLWRTKQNALIHPLTRKFWEIFHIALLTAQYDNNHIDISCFLRWMHFFLNSKNVGFGDIFVMSIFTLASRHAIVNFISISSTPKSICIFFRTPKQT